MERQLVAALIQSRKAWEQAKPNIVEKDISPEGNILIKLIGEYYDADSQAKDVDRTILKQRIERGVSSNKLARALGTIVDSLPTDVSTVNVIQELRDIRKHGLGLQIASLLTASKFGDELNDLIHKFQELETTAAVEGTPAYSAVPVKTIVETRLNPDNLIQIWPKSLNDRLDGGALPGHHIVLYAYTEVGKTLFAINMVAGFIHQKKRVLYICNEEPVMDVLLRAITRLTGMNKYEVKDDPDKAQALLDKRGYELLVAVPLSPGDFGTIDSLVTEHNPDVVVLDQLRNINVKQDNRTQALEKAAIEARNLAIRRRVLVVSLTQAGDSANGKRYLGKGDIDGSNVGIPGQADVMIGVGADSEMEQQNLRMISLSKNKMSGNHDPITVAIDPAISRVVDL